jgi:DNA-binding NarL/FixJ family response regulator
MVQTTVLMVGASDKSHLIEELPIRLVRLDTGAEAVKSLKKEKIDAFISRWDLVDVPDGKLLQNVVAASPSMPTLALIEPGNYSQEIKAAQLGVTAIISSDADDDYFRRVVSQLLGFEAMMISMADTHTL